MSEGSNNKTLLILNAVQLVIIGVLAYLLFDSNKQIESLNNDIVVNNDEISHLKGDLLWTKENLEVIRAEREALGLSVDSLDAQILDE